MQPVPRSNPHWRLGPLTIAGIYLAVSWVYIIGSSTWVYSQLSSHEWDRGERIELVKGLVFVTLTAGLIWWLVRRLTRQLEAETARAEALAETNRQLFDAMPEPAWVYDDQSLRFLEVNSAAVRTYGWSRDEFLGMTIRQIRPAEDMPRLEEALAKKRRGVYSSGVCRHMSRDGRIFRVGVTSQSLTYLGRPAWLVVASRVEELVAAQEAVERLNRDLENRVLERTRGLRRALAELEWFTEAVSHDLRRPVSHLGEVARALAHSAADRLTLQETESVHRLIGAAVRLEHLVEELLADSHQVQGVNDRNAVSLAVLIHGVLGELGRRPSERPDRVRVEEPLYWVRAHRPTLARTVTGLLLMALRSSVPGSEVRISATADATSVGLVITAAGEWIRPDDRWLLSPPDDAVASGVHGERELTVLTRSVRRMGGELRAELDAGRSPPVCTLTLTLARATAASGEEGPVGAAPNAADGPPTIHPA